jgi:hypothetical protein
MKPDSTVRWPKHNRVKKIVRESLTNFCVILHFACTEHRSCKFPTGLRVKLTPLFLQESGIERFARRDTAAALGTSLPTCYFDIVTETKERPR